MIDLYTLEKKSIKLALEGEWQSAVSVNKEILSQEPDNLPALNRLAKALIEIGQLTEAKNTINKILSLDPYNKVAKSNLQTANILSKSKSKATPAKPQRQNFSNVSFIEEPGKTLVVSLINLGNPETILNLQTGQEVFFKQLSRKIKIVDSHHHYVGSLPDDISATLHRFLKLGNKYSLHIRSVNSHVDVFIKELKKSSKLKGMASFNTKRSEFVLPPVTPKIDESPLEIFDEDYHNE